MAMVPMVVLCLVTFVVSTTGTAQSNPDSHCQVVEGSTRCTSQDAATTDDTVSLLTIKSQLHRRTKAAPKVARESLDPINPPEDPDHSCHYQAPGNSCRQVVDVPGLDCHQWYKISDKPKYKLGQGQVVMCHHKRFRAGCRAQSSGLGLGMLGSKTQCFIKPLTVPPFIQQQCDAWRNLLIPTTELNENSNGANAVVGFMTQCPARYIEDCIMSLEEVRKHHNVILGDGGGEAGPDASDEVDATYERDLERARQLVPILDRLLADLEGLDDVHLVEHVRQWIDGCSR